MKTITIEHIGGTGYGWIAKITGFDTKFKFSREFVGTRDFSHSNSKKTRGIFTSANLADGEIYQVEDPTSWGNTDYYYCQVKGKKMERLIEEQVIRRLKRRGAPMTDTIALERSAARKLADILKNRIDSLIIDIESKIDEWCDGLKNPQKHSDLVSIEAGERDIAECISSLNDPLIRNYIRGSVIDKTLNLGGTTMENLEEFLRGSERSFMRDLRKYDNQIIEIVSSRIKELGKCPGPEMIDRFIRSVVNNCLIRNEERSKYIERLQNEAIAIQKKRQESAEVARLKVLKQQLADSAGKLGVNGRIEVWSRRAHKRVYASNVIYYHAGTDAGYFKNQTGSPDDEVLSFCKNLCENWDAIIIYPNLRSDYAASCRSARHGWQPDR